jgi:hypothetical protein
VSPRTAQQLESTAYHEGAHVVLANKLGLGPSIISASIERTGNFRGRVQFSAHNDLMQHPSGLVEGLALQGFAPWQRIEPLIMETWAGPLAAQRTAPLLRLLDWMLTWSLSGTWLG